VPPKRGRPIAEPVVPTALDPADVGDLDDDTHLDEVAVGHGVDIGRAVHGLTITSSTFTGRDSPARRSTESSRRTCCSRTATCRARRSRMRRSAG
jgi:hypothetical protein